MVRIMAKRPIAFNKALNKIQSAAEEPADKAGDGRKLIAARFHPNVSKALKMEAIESDTTVQALVTEAIQLLFDKKGIKTPVE